MNNNTIKFTKSINSNKVTFPNKITLLRIILSFFMLLFLFFEIFINLYVYLFIIWVLITFNEVTDLLDGYIARKYKLISGVGKILDPYADVIQHLTYFVFFFYKGITPYYFFVIFIYRELSMGFLRNLLIQFNIVQQANFLGKLKSIFYLISTYFSLLIYTLSSLRYIKFIENFVSYYLSFNFSLEFIIKLIYAVTAFISFISFLGYLLIFLGARRYEK